MSAIQAEVAALTRACRADGSGLFLRLPLVILLLRSSLEGLSRALYPLWTHTAECRTALEAMDKVCLQHPSADLCVSHLGRTQLRRTLSAYLVVHTWSSGMPCNSGLHVQHLDPLRDHCAQIILQWTDPHGYHRKVPVLQSTPAALQVMARQRRATHTPVRRHANDVSPLASAVLADAGSPEARRILFQKQRCDLGSFLGSDAFSVMQRALRGAVWHIERMGACRATNKIRSRGAADCRLNLFGRAEASQQREHVGPKQYSGLSQDGVSKMLSQSKRHELMAAMLRA